MYAIIQNGAHQYKVKAGAFLRVEKQLGEPGLLLTHDKVLAFSDKEGRLAVGMPYVAGAKVHFRVIRHGKGKKKLVFKKKRRKGYRRTQGHRQEFTEIYVETLSDSTGQKLSIPLKKKGEQKKPEQTKAEQKKPEQKSPEQKKTEQTKAGQKVSEQKSLKSNTTEQKPQSPPSLVKKASPISAQTKSASNEGKLKKADKTSSKATKPKKEGV